MVFVYIGVRTDGWWGRTDGWMDSCVCLCEQRPGTIPPPPQRPYKPKPNKTTGLASLLDAQARACRAEGAWFARHLSPVALGEARSSLWWVRLVGVGYVWGGVLVCGGVDGWMGG